MVERLWPEGRPEDRQLEQALIRGYLASTPPSNNVRSCLYGVMRDTRAAALRDPDTGEPVHEDHSTSWLGTIGYLVMLDQLGTALRYESEPSAPADDPPTIIRSLRRFAPEVDEVDREILYALRCALAHDYGLQSAPKPGKRLTARHRQFYLHSSDDDWLTLQPRQDWPGSSRAADEKDRRRYSTGVNLRAVANLAESVVVKARAAGEAGKLAVDLEGGLSELWIRYFFFYTPEE